MRSSGLAIFAALGLASSVAAAEPVSRWTGVRQGTRTIAEKRAVELADQQLSEGVRMRRLASGFDPLGASGYVAHQQEARRILEAVGGGRARPCCCCPCCCCPRRRCGCAAG